ncbi:MAG TPA: hypothetical protein VLV89_05195 [Candidatus Acidoferrum sp.]|nr:hypothetical protein [Candidatus Acidoferrum sp.]
MDMKKTVGAIVAAFVVYAGTGYLIHEVLLKSAYTATADLWRPEDAMQHKLWIMLLSEFIFAVGAVLVYQRGLEKKSWVGQGIRFGILLSLVSSVPGYMMNYVVINVGHRLALHWILSGIAQAIIVALVIAVICQPKSDAA